MITILSNGSASGTKVFAADGAEIKGVTKIEIADIKPNGSVSAVLHFSDVKLDLKANNENDCTELFCQQCEWQGLSGQTTDNYCPECGSVTKLA